MNARAERRGSRGRGLLVYAILYLAFLYVPVLLLPLFSFNNSLFITFPLQGFTTRWYTAMAADEGLRAALLNTLKVGAVPSDESLFRLPDVPEVAVGFALAPGSKCQRCWKVLPEVGRHHAHPLLCERCADAVERRAAAA